MIEPFKYLIQPVAVERGENGRVVREMPGEVIAVYNADQAVEAIREFEKTITEDQTGNIRSIPSSQSQQTEGRAAFPSP